jgi:hypothetical protein
MNETREGDNDDSEAALFAALPPDFLRPVNLGAIPPTWFGLECRRRPRCLSKTLRTSGVSVVDSLLLWLKYEITDTPKSTYSLRCRCLLQSSSVVSFFLTRTLLFMFGTSRTDNGFR